MSPSGIAAEDGDVLINLSSLLLHDAFGNPDEVADFLQFQVTVGVETAGYWYCTRNEDCTYKEEDKDSPALGHERDEGSYVEETCETAGYWKCVRYDVCKHTEENPEDPATHLITVVTEAECEKEGLKKCNREGCEYKKVLSALGHERNEDGYVEQTCTEPGYWKCVRYDTCKHTEVNPSDPAKHLIVITEATCLEDGLEECSRCDNYEKVLPALDHDWETTEATCTTDGEKTYTCAVCDETKTEKVDALGHSWGEGEVTTETTCPEDPRDQDPFRHVYPLGLPLSARDHEALLPHLYGRPLV